MLLLFAIVAFVSFEIFIFKKFGDEIGEGAGLVVFIPFVVFILLWFGICINHKNPTEQVYYEVSRQTGYTYNIDLSEEEKEKALLLDKAGITPTFIYLKADEVKAVDLFWTWPISNGRSEKTKWIVDVEEK